MSSRPFLSVVIPAYNEEARIAPTLRAVDEYLSAFGHPYEILVVDDGSTDGTREVTSQLAAGEVANLRLIECFPNHGKGHVVRVGMLTARGDVRLFMDADNATPITELPKLLAKLREGAEVAIGSRRADGAVMQKAPPWYRRIWSRIGNAVVQAGLLAGIKDTQCGFKLFTSGATQAIFRRAHASGWGFDLEILALARRLGYPIAEVAVTWSDDARTKIHPIRDAIRITREYLRIRRAFQRGEYDLPSRPSVKLLSV
jgi:dolichyl-phosphate beta-glucosyltransferase